jgi:hypothetical protein
MKITRNNYEIFFLDFYEGRLSNDRIEELFHFLKQHQDLNAEFQQFENITLSETNEDTEFPLKSKMKKPEILPESEINENNYQEVFIAFHEGDLNEHDKTKLLLFLNENPQLKEEFELFSRLKLYPADNVIFPAKNALKKKITLFNKKIILQYAASVASVVLLAFAGYIGMNYFFTTEFGSLAESSYRQNFPEMEFRVSQNSEESKSIFASHIYNNTNTASIRKSEQVSIEKIPVQQTAKINTGRIGSQIPEDNFLRTEYAEIYNLQNEKLKQNMHDSNISQGDSETRLFDRVINIVRENSENAGQQISNFNPWQLAEYGVKGFNLLTDNDIDFRMKSNDEGEVTKVAFNDFAVPVRINR